MREARPFLQLCDVGHTFADDGRAVLSDINLQIEPEAFVALVGASGIGKSTLLRILGGLLTPASGDVLLNGRDIRDVDLPIGIVFQKDNLMPWRTALENVRLPLEIRRERGPDVDERARRMLQLVGLEADERAYPSQLSGGMAQRVAIARALVHQPQLLLLDEPFGALDALTRERMGQELLRIWQVHPVTVVMVTHSIAEAVFLADDVLVMGETAPGGPATIRERVPIDIPRPRGFDVRRTAAFQACEVHIRAAIGNGDRT